MHRTFLKGLAAAMLGAAVAAATLYLLVLSEVPAPLQEHLTSPAVRNHVYIPRARPHEALLELVAQLEIRAGIEIDFKMPAPENVLWRDDPIEDMALARCLLPEFEFGDGSVSECLAAFGRNVGKAGFGFDARRKGAVYELRLSHHDLPAADTCRILDSRVEPRDFLDMPPIDFVDELVKAAGFEEGFPCTSIDVGGVDVMGQYVSVLHSNSEPAGLAFQSRQRTEGLVSVGMRDSPQTVRDLMTAALQSAGPSYIWVSWQFGDDYFTVLGFSQWNSVRFVLSTEEIVAAIVNNVSPSVYGYPGGQQANEAFRDADAYTYFLEPVRVNVDGHQGQSVMETIRLPGYPEKPNALMLVDFFAELRRRTHLNSQEVIAALRRGRLWEHCIAFQGRRRPMVARLVEEQHFYLSTLLALGPEVNDIVLEGLLSMPPYDVKWIAGVIPIPGEFAGQYDAVWQGYLSKAPKDAAKTIAQAITLQAEVRNRRLSQAGIAPQAASESDVWFVY